MKYLRLKNKTLQEAFEKVVPNFGEKLQDCLKVSRNSREDIQIYWTVQVGPEQNDVDVLHVYFSPNMFEVVEEKTNILLNFESEEDARKLYDMFLKVKARSAYQEDSFFKDVRSIELVGDER